MRSASGVPAAGTSLRRETATGETPSRYASANITSISAILVISLYQNNRLPHIPSSDLPAVSVKALVQLLIPQVINIKHTREEEIYTWNNESVQTCKDYIKNELSCPVVIHILPYQCKSSMIYFQKTDQ